MSTHDFLDGFQSFSCVVEKDPRYMVVQDVCFYGAVEDVTANETKISVNS
jgi:hypothetical protein